METSDDDKTQRLLAASEPAENPIPTTSANPRNSEWYYPAPVASGLSSSDASRRLEHFGPNALEEKEVNIWLKFASYFWGPVSVKKKRSRYPKIRSFLSLLYLLTLSLHPRLISSSSSRHSHLSADAHHDLDCDIDRVC